MKSIQEAWQGGFTGGAGDEGNEVELSKQGLARTAPYPGQAGSSLLAASRQLADTA